MHRSFSMISSSVTKSCCLQPAETCGQLFDQLLSMSREEPGPTTCFRFDDTPGRSSILLYIPYVTFTMGSKEARNGIARFERKNRSRKSLFCWFEPIDRSIDENWPLLNDEDRTILSPWRYAFHLLIGRLRNPLVSTRSKSARSRGWILKTDTFHRSARYLIARTSCSIRLRIGTVPAGSVVHVGLTRQTESFERSRIFSGREC